MWDVLHKHVKVITKNNNAILGKARNFESRWDNEYDDYNACLGSIIIWITHNDGVVLYECDIQSIEVME